MEGMFDDLPKMLGCLAIVIAVVSMAGGALLLKLFEHLHFGWH